MYTRFYGLREKPFSLTPDPRFLFLSDAHREAMAHLLYGIEEGQGFIAVTGEVGTGKTTLCRTLLRRLDPSMEVAFIFHPQLSGLELLQAINSELGLPSQSDSRRDLLDSLHAFLLEKKREERRVLLIVDEAQTLEPDALEQLRLVSNLETETEKLIHIVLLGQPELDSVLARSEHRQLRQRITVRWDLGPLSAPETRAYVVHRLRVAAGARRDVFTPEGLREVHRLSGGVPRLINAICDRALLAGYAKDARRIGPDIVREAHRELRAETPEGARAGLGAGLDWPRIAFLAAAAAFLVVATAALTWWLMAGRAAPASTAAAPSTLAPIDAMPPVAAGAPPRQRSERPATRPVSLGQTATVDAAPPGIAPTAGARREDEPPVEIAALLQSAPAVPPAEAAHPSLADALARSSPAATAAASLEALLAQWQLPPDGSALLSLEGLLEGLEASGLAALHLPATTLPALAGMDQPALLVLRALDGAPRYAALVGLRDGRAQLAGLADRPMEVAADELEGLFSGEAFVPWRDFAGLPGLLAPGARGRPVTWLQQSLAALGLYQGPPSGRFDANTLAAVRALQQAGHLHADGRVGPVTKIRLYQMMDDYAVPRLADAQPPTAVRARADAEGAS